MKKICAVVAACLVAHGLTGDLYASESALTIPTAPFIAKEHNTKVHKNNYILAVGVDEVVITANGLVPFPTLITQHGFQGPIDNSTNFVIPRNGTYLIEAKITSMMLGPNSTNAAVEILVDGESNFARSTELSSNYYVGGTNIPTFTMTRILTLYKGQTISLLLNSAAGSTITIPPSDTYPGFSNRALNIALINR